MLFDVFLESGTLFHTNDAVKPRGFCLLFLHPNQIFKRNNASVALFSYSQCSSLVSRKLKCVIILQFFGRAFELSPGLIFQIFNSFPLLSSFILVIIADLESRSKEVSNFYQKIIIKAIKETKRKLLPTHWESTLSTSTYKSIEGKLSDLILLLLMMCPVYTLWRNKV